MFVDLIAAVEKTVGHRYVRDDTAPKGGKASKAKGKAGASARKSAAKTPTAKASPANRSASDLPKGAEPASFRIIADHSRAVAFLLADGVFPSNEGRGYVLRRILRRAVRHAWLLGRREPTLVEVVRVVIDQMGDVYPELRQRAKHIIDTTRAEEERFLATIEGGMKRFDELAPEKTTQGSTAIHGTIAGEDAFKLYDTFGFPIDLTELMARERGYSVDIAGFEAALQAQRTQSQEERRSKKVGIEQDLLGVGEWVIGAVGATLGGIVDAAAGTRLAPSTKTKGAQEAGLHLAPGVSFTGYDSLDVDTDVIAKRDLADGRVAVMLRETPFYAESGGQISDRGEIQGEGWRVDVDEVRKVDGRIAAVGKRTGDVKLGNARASVPRDRRRDTERNHTATHLLHAALRQVLGEHVHQAGSLVAPDRLRFDFTHHGPLTPHQLVEVEGQTDVLTMGIPFICPYNVNSIMNPILVMCLGLGYFFNMYRGRPLVREGGVLIMSHPTPWEFHPVHHPSYIDFFEQVLADTTNPAEMSKKWEKQYAEDEWYRHLYRTGNAYHGVHPFYAWYWGAHGLQHAGKVIIVGGDPPTVRRLGFTPASTMDDAFEIASDVVGRSPTITHLHVPALLIADVQ